VRRIAHGAFQGRAKAREELTSVVKANVRSETSQFGRDVRAFFDVSKEYADVELSHMYVDNAAMQGGEGARRRSTWW